MGTRGFIQRFLPFVAAFAVGIFVASFFVHISGPKFRGGKKARIIKQLKMENEQLRMENLRLRNEIEAMTTETMNSAELPPLPPMPAQAK
jgi:hypothetical protein